MSRVPEHTGHGLAETQQGSSATFEPHFSVDELAELWGMSTNFVRRLFINEPGVVVFHHARPGRRVYRTLRIPDSVARRVHRRMSRTTLERDNRPA